MAKPLVTDELRTIIQPLLPKEPPKPKGGRPRVSDRAALTGILFVLQTGLPWEWLPRGLGCRAGMTCWRRLRDWNRANVRHRLHPGLLRRVAAARWVAERTIAWLFQYRRLAIRWERRDDIHQAFLDLACAAICFRMLR